MAVRQFSVEGKTLGNYTLRIDAKYNIFTELYNWTVFSTNRSQVELSYYLKRLPIIKYTKGELDDEVLIVNISDQDQRSGYLSNLEYVKEIGSDKNYLSDSDIFVSKLGMPKGYIYMNPTNSQILIGSTEFIPYKVFNIEPIILKNILLLPRMLEAYTNLESGKTPSHKRVNPFEFLKIKIPILTQKEQLDIAEQISNIDKKISDLKKEILPQYEIINKVFSEEFGFDKKLYLEFGKGMTAGTQNSPDKKLRVFDIDFSEMYRSETLRTSCRYHNPPTQKLMDILDQYPTKKLKDIIVEIIHRGASPQYASAGTIPVIKTGHLKNSYIDHFFEEFVEEEFYNKKIKSQIFNGDILIASTGKVSLGKIDIVNSDDKFVCDGHISILRLDETLYNKLFLVYFFRSILGYFQIERDYTGATNQIELYVNEIANFLIPDISITEQERIVNEIKEQIDKQEFMQNEIKKLRSKIDQVIEDALLN